MKRTRRGEGDGRSVLRPLAAKAYARSPEPDPANRNAAEQIAELPAK